MSIGSHRPGVAIAGRESLEASDGALDEANRSSYKGLFLECLAGRWPCRPPPRFLLFLFISKAKNHRTTSIYIRMSEKGETKRVMSK